MLEVLIASLLNHHYEQDFKCRDKFINDLSASPAFLKLLKTIVSANRLATIVVIPISFFANALFASLKYLWVNIYSHSNRDQVCS